MPKRPLLTSRTLLVVVSLITIALLVGSLLLQRIVFHAAEMTSSVYLAPISFTVAPQGTVTFAPKVDLSTPTQLVGAELALKFDPKQFSFDRINAPDDWQVIKNNQTDGLVEWAVVPKAADNNLAMGTITLGSVSFIAKGSGTANISFDPSKTIVSVFDGGHSPSLYNAVSSLQDASGTISDSPDASKAVAPPAENPVQTAPLSSLGQQILSTDIIALPTGAILKTTLRYPGKIALRFGRTEQLTNSLQPIGNDRQIVLPLAGLVPSTRYFFQITTTDSASGSLITSRVQSFKTIAEAANNAAIFPNKSVVSVFPGQAQSSTTMYMLLADAQGAAVTDQKPTLTLVSGQAKIAPLSQQNGAYQSVITSLTSEPQNVVIRATVNDQNIGQVTMRFDPKLTSAQSPNASSTQSISWDSKTIILLVGVLIGIFLVGLVLVRAARAK